MVSNNHYAMVGSFVVLLMVSALVIVVWLTTGISRAHYERYIIRSHESVAGLSIKSAVKYNGVNVGFVRSIDLNANFPDSVDIALDVDGRIKIHTDTQAFLEGQGLTGIMSINLRGGKSTTPLLTPVLGENYPVMILQPTLSTRAEKRLQELSATLIHVSHRVSAFLSPENQESINKLLRNTAKASEVLPQTLTNMSQTSQTLQTTLQVVNNSVLPQVNHDLEKMSQITDHISALSQDLHREPSIFIRGKSDSQKGPGEK